MRPLPRLTRPLTSRTTLPVSRLLKGTVLLDLERLENALESFDRALALTPDAVTAWYRKGKTFAGLRKYTEAIDCFDRVIAADLGWRFGLVPEKAVPCSRAVILKAL